MECKTVHGVNYSKYGMFKTVHGVNYSKYGM